jgi:alpha-galactosidase
LDAGTPVVLSPVASADERSGADVAVPLADARSLSDPTRRPPMVEVLAVGQGRAPHSLRAVGTAIGSRLRPVRHAVTREGLWEVLEIVQRDSVTDLAVTTRLARRDPIGAYRATTTVANFGAMPVLLQVVTSLVISGLSGYLGRPEGARVWQARSEWCAESRWYPVPLGSQAGLADINPVLHGQDGRCVYALTSTSTWSSGQFVPVGAIEGGGRAVVWQLEVNAPWRWEIIAAGSDYAVALMGPTDPHHAWIRRLEPGETFTTVPVSFSLAADAGTGGGLDGAAPRGALAGAVGELTRHRRVSRLDTGADAGRPLIYNDYMNALMGDPTAEKVLPLVDSAAAVGAQVFCIDAGWYDDGGDWWPSVGAWEPSLRRFGSPGLEGIFKRVRAAGMRPGLWIEPEVVGIRSPKATALPEACFMHRAGRRIVEHQRFFLDLRSPLVRDYLDSVFERLIGELGALYFKWDYNVTPGLGPDDAGAEGPGDGLLEHARAHLAWFEALRSRHPGVIFEACSSGAQRMDQAILSVYDLQSTSDQQDYRLYPPIAASAPMAMAPEQAANWAYPQPGMAPEEVAFTLVTGLSGRLYLSGPLDQLAPPALELVREAAGVYPSFAAHHAAGLPFWPLGLPQWADPVVALGSLAPSGALIHVWRRTGPQLAPGGSSDCDRVKLSIPAFAGRQVLVQQAFPSRLPNWRWSWLSDSGQLLLDFAGTAESARSLRLTPV